MQPDAVGQADDLSVGAGLASKNIVLVGLPGAGKSTVGRRLASRLSIPFADADAEIERAANMTIQEMFASHGEAVFREGETRVIARLLAEGPQVIATGGGAFMSQKTREAIAERGISVWLDAPTEVLHSRVARRSHRPLFNGVDMMVKLKELRAVRDPVFALADVRVVSSFGPHERVVNKIVAALERRGATAAGGVGAPDAAAPISTPSDATASDPTASDPIASGEAH